MRLFSRLYVVCALAACIILYLAWFPTSQNLGDLVPLAPGTLQAGRTFDQRLVVFGDSWSDNETREAQGMVWTDWLCSMVGILTSFGWQLSETLGKFISCHQENLAQTANAVFRDRRVGSVVDNRELELRGRLSQTCLADFKVQLRQWLDADSRLLEGLSPDQIQSRQRRTIFVVSFGVWDLWSLMTKDYETALSSVARRIQVVMDQLDELSERWGLDGAQGDSHPAG
ncbi:hypothetical protein N7512_001043 [Penicillium capsulatum]|nr:hypothetical protein N7512_001043 [Penicillium capsulatum]